MQKEKTPSALTVFGLAGMIFCMSDVRAGVGPFLSVFLKSHLHWSSDKVGVALGTADFVAALSQIPSGFIVDTCKRKRLLIFLACVAIVIGCLFMLKFPFFSYVIGSQALIGLATALLPPAIASITLGLFGRERYPKRISINETWGHIGNVVTAASAGLLGYFFGRPWILYMVIFYSASSVGFLSLIKSKEINHSIARGLEKGMENRAPAPVFYYLKKSKLLIFCFSVFLFHFANAAQLPIVVQDLSKTHEDADSLFMGASIILSQAVMIGVAYGTGFLMQIVGRKPIFLIAFAVLPLRAFLFTLTDQPLLLLAIELLDGFGVGIYGVIGVISISDISKGTGRFNFSLGLMALAQGIGASLSNTLAGFIANSYSFQAAFLTLALIALVGMSFYTFFMTETKNQAT